MKYYPEKYQRGDFVFFLHIPKTAGTSLTNSLKSAFDQKHSLTPEQMNNVRKYPQDIFLNAEFLYGHFTHDVYSKRLPKQPNYVLTFLREPVEHFISTYFHLKMDPSFTYTIRLTRDKQHAEEIHSVVKNMAIEDFLESRHRSLFDNFQTRYLVRGLSSTYNDCDDEQLLPIAQRLLLNLPFFGLTDRFDDSLTLLESVMGIENKLQLLKANKSRNKPNNFVLSQAVLTEIQQKTSVDRALFECAQEGFEARFGAYTAKRRGR